MVVVADQSGSLGVVSTAQSDAQGDPEDGTDRRLVGRESSERVDAIVIALWSIAAGMTVMLGIFLWHTSPRRRLRLARRRSTQLYQAGGQESEQPAEDGSAAEPEAGSVEDAAGGKSPEPGSESVEDAAAGKSPEPGSESVEDAAAVDGPGEGSELVEGGSEDERAPQTAGESGDPERS